MRRVSILISVYQAAATLRACLRSVARQSLADWECVLVDDGSTDGSTGLARELTAGDGRFRVLERRHEGLVASLNAGLGLCRGRYLARMDADDLMHRRRLEEQVDLLDSQPRLAAVGCHVRLFPRSSLKPGYRAYERWLNAIVSPEDVRREAFVECPVAHPTLMVRRERIAAEGYREMDWPEDYDLVLRLLGQGHEIGMLARRRLCWRRGRATLSGSSARYAVERFVDCKAAFLATSFLSGTDRYILWGHGGTGRALRRALERLGKRPTHIVELHPGRLGNRIHGADVIAWPDLPAAGRRPIVVSVAGAGPRGRIRFALASMGYRETRDFVCAA